MRITSFYGAEQAVTTCPRLHRPVFKPKPWYPPEVPGVTCQKRRAVCESDRGDLQVRRRDSQAHIAEASVLLCRLLIEVEHGDAPIPLNMLPQPAVGFDLLCNT